jgi:hypothetical protein
MQTRSQMVKPPAILPEDPEMDRKIRLLYQAHGANLATFVQRVQRTLRDRQSAVEQTRARTQTGIPTGS